MMPAGPGRHCAACQQVVVDFTQKSDAELLAYLARASTAPCGRFRADQLARPLVLPATPSHWRSWLASVLALGGVLGAGRAAVQASGNYFSAGPTPTTVQPAVVPALTPAPVHATEPPASAAPTSAGGSLLVRGRVVGQQDSLGLPGVMVLLQGTTQGCNTDVNGDFELALPATAATGTLLFSYVGYSQEQLPVAVATSAMLVLKIKGKFMGEMGVVVGGYAARKPWPWHPRRLYQWSKYQLLRPFRQ